MPMSRSPNPPGSAAAISLVRAEVRAHRGPSIILRSNELCAQIEALAPDLFRFRVAHGTELPDAPSWAVLKREWPLPPVRIFKGARSFRLQTTEGQFRLNLGSGEWALEDKFGLVLFHSRPGATRFCGASPGLNLTLQEGEAIFGLGESSGTFNKRGLIREFWNIDVGGHARAVYAGLRNLYVSIPFAISLRHGRAAGLFWDNPARQFWDLGQTVFDRWQLSAASGEIDLYLFLGPACPQILERFTELTGRMPMIPLWGLGYQQCRYSYETREHVEQIGREFRRRHIPCDVLYLDIHYMDGYRVFTFGKNFPNPREMAARLARRGFKLVTIVDPGVKDDPKFDVLRRGQAGRAFVKAPDGQSDYRGKVWPGQVRFPDFLNAAVRHWWGEEQARFQKLGISGFWNDMNEPADFSGPNKDFPSDCLHRTDFGEQRHATVHNVYGSQMARASFDGARTHDPARRPFIVTRAAYAGVQRFAAVWTGDNDSSWEHLADSVQMLLNLGLSGVPFCGADVGGFHDNTTGELLARWTQLGAFTPFFRNHSNIGTISQEPWAFGPEIEEICRRYIELRYQLLPYWHGLLVQAHRHGTPMIRPLFWHYQNDPAAQAASDQFMLGRDLLIAPILRHGATARSVYLPNGLWFDFWTGESLRGGTNVLAMAELARLPIYVRAGAILPMIPVQQYVGESAWTRVNLHIWPGDDGELDWYEEDGLSWNYASGGFHGRTLSHLGLNRACRLSFGERRGNLPSAVKRWRVVLRAAARRVRTMAPFHHVQVRFNPEFALCVFDLPNRKESFSVEWR
jgi:alpha-glucosidase